MPIIVEDINKPYYITIKSDADTLVFKFRQLCYNTRSKIAALTNRIEKGEVITDSSLVCFLNLKYGLLDVEGFTNSDGTPFKLQFESCAGAPVTDDCLNSLLSTPMQMNLLYVGKAMFTGIPSGIVHPVTGKPLEGVEVVKEKPGTSENKKKE